MMQLIQNRATGSRILALAIAGARNVISANGDDGVLIFDAVNNRVMGNFVGTDASGTQDLGNSGQGVSDHGGTATGNRILSNSIFSNGGLGIDLGADGTTPNDPGDTDTGPNYRQNFPVVTSARTGDGKTTVRGTLDSTPNRTFRAQLFSNLAGTDEGKKLIGQQKVTTGASGNASFSFSPKSKVAVGLNITATVTDSGGNTSEFSAPEKVLGK